MVPESSLPHLQGPATCTYFEPEHSAPCLLIPLLEDPLYYLIIPTPRLPSWLAFSRGQIKDHVLENEMHGLWAKRRKFEVCVFLWWRPGYLFLFPNKERSLKGPKSHKNIC